MKKMYLPSTPVASRVKEGHFVEAVLPPRGTMAGPVYVYDAAIRLWHWVTALCIVVLAVTGYFIGSPLPSVGGEAYESYLFGWIRFTHFAAGRILGVAFLLRLYRVLTGGPHARQIFYIPFWSIAWWKDVFSEIGWYLFIMPSACPRGRPWHPRGRRVPCPSRTSARARHSATRARRTRCARAAWSRRERRS